MKPVLEGKGLGKDFSGVVALAEVDVSVAENEVHAIVGPNGSGKTTLFNVLSGFLRPTRGRVFWKGEDVTGTQPHQLVRQGLVRTFQHAAVFPTLTVEENFSIAGLATRREGSPRSFGDLSELLNLSEYRGIPAQDLPYGAQRNLGVGLALATSPDVLLLDEPAAGLSEAETTELARVIREVRAAGTAVMLIDHDIPFVLPLADRVTVLVAGEKLTEGSAQEIRTNARVIEAYLGKRYA